MSGDKNLQPLGHGFSYTRPLRRDDRSKSWSRPVTPKSHIFFHARRNRHSRICIQATVPDHSPKSRTGLFNTVVSKTTQNLPQVWTSQTNKMSTIYLMLPEIPFSRTLVRTLGNQFEWQPGCCLPSINPLPRLVSASVLNQSLPCLGRFPKKALRCLSTCFLKSSKRPHILVATKILQRLHDGPFGDCSSQNVQSVFVVRCSLAATQENNCSRSYPQSGPVLFLFALACFPTVAIAKTSKFRDHYLNTSFPKSTSQFKCH